ncbi:MAG: nucleoside recognition protein [Roseburia sp.]|nr:nucleoside recognition protein [Roseburia sp.]MCM1242292.1 nucleoside recognition protein [Roseburia sp.]
MLNYIWAFMILIGIVFGAFSGNMEAVSKAALDSAGEAVSLCITMIGVMSLWVGLMEIAQKSGLIARMTKGISPFITFLFPNIPRDHPARGYISTNLIANILGLGWACTPAGLKAMEELAKLEAERGNPEYIDGEPRPKKALLTDGGAGKKESIFGKRERTASKEMCDFLILNISSLQLIPVNMIVYRQQYGSVNPTAVIAPAIVATFISTAVAVVYCKVKGRKRLRKDVF